MDIFQKDQALIAAVIQKSPRRSIAGNLDGGLLFLCPLLLFCWTIQMFMLLYEMSFRKLVFFRDYIDCFSRDLLKVNKEII